MKFPTGLLHRKKEEKEVEVEPKPKVNIPRQASGLSISSAWPNIYRAPKAPRQFKSYRLRGEYVQPWADDKRMKRTRVGNWIVLGFVGIAVVLSGYIMYTGAKQAQIPPQCLIMEDHFDKLNTDNWGYEVQTGGWGTGEFDWTTNDPKNTFVDKDGLHIVPTLTTESTSITEAQLLNGYTLNITKSDGDGSCTSTDVAACGVKSNSTLGSVIPPVRSARITTKGKKSIKYGRVEIVAKMAKGDWLWPALWMMPEDNVYGAWPRSGEIDIAETRGNPWQYPEGRDFVSSTLHFGPSYQFDAYRLTRGFKFLQRTDYTSDFHTYGLEWTENYMMMYIDSRLNQLSYVEFGENNQLWNRGGFAGVSTANGTLFDNPWKGGGWNAPFDQKFYLILNVAVGAQNGWFFDNKGNKPWVDGSDYAARDFYKAKDQWLPTWGAGTERGMTVKSVKMWRAGNC